MTYVFCVVEHLRDRNYFSLSNKNPLASWAEGAGMLTDFQVLGLSPCQVRTGSDASCFEVSVADRCPCQGESCSALQSWLASVNNTKTEELLSSATPANYLPQPLFPSADSNWNSWQKELTRQKARSTLGLNPGGFRQNLQLKWCRK